MTTETHENHQADCLMCAVRALTEGTPRIWVPKTAGENISGVVLKQGTVATDFGRIPFVDLWLGGHERIRLMAYSNAFRHALDGAAAQVGDTLTAWFDGDLEIANGKWAGKTYKAFSANVQRGH